MTEQTPIGEAIEFARAELLRDRMSMRELAKRSGVSAAQISRIESGAVKQPAAQTIVALARALEIHPYPLLILAGYVETEEARERLRSLLAGGGELSEAWRRQGMEDETDYLSEWREILRDPDSTRADLNRVASDAFVLAHVGNESWDQALMDVGGAGPRSDDLREAAELWPELTAERRARVLDFLRDQAALSRAERAAQLERGTDRGHGGSEHATR